MRSAEGCCSSCLAQMVSQTPTSLAAGLSAMAEMSRASAPLRFSDAKNKGAPLCFLPELVPLFSFLFFGLFFCCFPLTRQQVYFLLGS